MEADYFEVEGVTWARCLTQGPEKKLPQFALDVGASGIRKCFQFFQVDLLAQTQLCLLPES